MITDAASAGPQAPIRLETLEAPECHGAQDA